MHGKVAAASKIAIHLRISRKVRRPRCNGHNSKLSARSSSVNRHQVPRLTKDYGHHHNLVWNIFQSQFEVQVFHCGSNAALFVMGRNYNTKKA